MHGRSFLSWNKIIDNKIHTAVHICNVYTISKYLVLPVDTHYVIVQTMISNTPENEFLYLCYFFNVVVSISLKYKPQKQQMTEIRAFQFQKKV